MHRTMLPALLFALLPVQSSEDVSLKGAPAAVTPPFTAS
jgi:hypothetical protein